MQVVTYTEVETEDIFDFAKEKFGLSWNECCDLFHRSEVLDDSNTQDFYLSDIERNLEKGYHKENEKAYQIIAAFMRANKISEFRYIYD